MGTNPYFQHFTDANEQDLWEDLTVEAIRNSAVDAIYLPRTGGVKDDMLNEFTHSVFNVALPVEMYVKNADSFEGDGQLLSKFGLEIRDQMTLVMSIRSFKEFIQPTTSLERPGEGDCIYVPFLGMVYQVKYVNSSAQFYTLGRLMSYEIVCELLEYNNEKFATGYPEIDDKYKQFGHADDIDYEVENDDIGADNKAIGTAADNVLDFSEANPFEVTRY